MVPHNMVTTAFTLDGYRIVRNLGLVRGIIVRSRSIVGTIGARPANPRRRQHYAADQPVRADARTRLRADAAARGQLGANAVIGMRYDATEIMQGVTEVLAYGTAVYVEKNT